MNSNLFANIPGELPGELTEALAELGPVRIERIVSRGHVSPEGFWYDQAGAEWVVLLQGRARLELDPGGELELTPGDWISLPTHRRHRVAWTDPDVDSIWLAVHIQA